MFIAKQKWVTVKSYRDVTYVGLRQFYWSEHHQQTLPSKKGIDLTIEEWYSLVDCMPDVKGYIDSFVKK
jgi:hypothetical protein